MIVVQLLGGMANQMFQYALGRHLSILNKTELFLDTSLLMNRVPLDKFTFRNFELTDFNIQASIAENAQIPVYPPHKSIKSMPNRIIHLLQVYLRGVKYIRENSMKFQPKFLDLKGNLYLDGNWQSEKYFNSISDVIKNDFKYTKTLSSKALKLVTQIQSEESICIHVRRGDYLMTSHHGIVNQDYIYKGISYIKSKTNYLSAYIFSNDIAWCKDNLQLDIPHHFIDEELAGNNDKEHFVLMQNCKHFVIANSSYSWWAAWLGNNPHKIVVAPKNWLTDSKFDTSDIYLPSWIII